MMSLENEVEKNKTKKNMVTWLLHFVKLEDPQLYETMQKSIIDMCKEQAKIYGIQDPSQLSEFISYCFETEISTTVIDLLRDYFGLAIHAQRQAQQRQQQ